MQKGEVYDAKAVCYAAKAKHLYSGTAEDKAQLEYGYIAEGGRKVPVYLNYGQHVELGDGGTGGFGMST